jgi:hypothetical protein
MKTKLLAVTVLLMAIAFLPGCKKEDTDTLKARMAGRWQVDKIETKTYDASGATVVRTETKPYTTADYFDFKNNENDELEINLGAGNRVMGNYVVLMGQTFNISLSNELLYCNTEVLTDNAFQFTGSVDKSSPKVTRTYYLKR